MRRPGKKRSSVMGKLILWGVLIVLVAVGGTALYGYLWVQDYLKSDAFRMQLAKQVGRAAKSEATIEKLSWSGPEVRVTQAALNAKRDQAWKSITADGLQATLDFGAARDGLWRVTRLDADSLRMDMRNAAEIPLNLPDEVEVPEKSNVPDWLHRWLPTRTQVDEVRVGTFNFVPPSNAPGVSASGLSVVGNPANDSGAWQLKGQGGNLTLPGFAEPFRLSNVSTRLDGKALVVHDATARWRGDCEVTARGDVPFDKSKPWSFNGTLSLLDLRHVMDANWNSRLGGVLDAEYEANPTVTKAKLRVKNGVVQNLPALHKVAEFTRVDRFRRIVLDVATADVERTTEVIKVSNLDLRSSGLIRIEGGFTVQKKEIKGEMKQYVVGDLLVGVAPDTLNWIIGSKDRVFTQTRTDAPGYVWTNVHIEGPEGEVNEDLTNRVMLAMGQGTIELAGKGFNVLTGAAGGTAAELTKDVLETGKSMLEVPGKAAGSVIEKGTDIIKGVFGR